MKYADIQKVASDIAVSYIAKGYSILPVNASWGGHSAIIFLRKGTDRVAVALGRGYFPDTVIIDTYEFQSKPDCDVINFHWDDEENRIDHRRFFAIDRNWFTEDVHEYNTARRIHEGRYVLTFERAHSFKPSTRYLAKMRKVYGFKTAKNISIIRSKEGYTVANDRNDRTHTVSFRDAVNYEYRFEQQRRRECARSC